MPSRPLRLFLTSAERRVLLARTALVSTLIAATPTPVSAQIAVFRPFSLFPVTVTNNSDCIFPGTCALINTILPFASIDFTNTGDFAVVGFGASAIFANTNFAFSPIDITNSGNIATAGFAAYGIRATTYGSNSPISIVNSGDIATAGFLAHGIYGYTYGDNSDLGIVNSGGIATSAGYADGISGYTYGNNSDLSIVNSGDISTRGLEAEGVFVTTIGRNASLSVVNSGTISTRGRYAEGINAVTYGTNSDLHIVNSGDIETTGFLSDGIFAETFGPSSPLAIHNSGSIRAEGILGYGIHAHTYGGNSPIEIENSGDIFGSTVGISAYSATSTMVVNSGSLSAGSDLAIDTQGASTTIHNTGLITGFVDLTDSSDTFVNHTGGEFIATDTAPSDFGGGTDLFRNVAGGTLRAASDGTNGERTSFVGLERFENRGLITMVDGRDNDVFRISNTPGGTDLTFVGSGDSTLAVDAFLGGPGSTSDTLVIEGNVSGRTRIAVSNTNHSSARFDPVGIPVVFVEGSVNENNFFIDKPIDAGFFDYDLFFLPTGSGFFELKNHAGGGAHILPHLVTVTHDTFHNTTETWFDQSTDLRVLLARGATCDDPGHPQDNVRCQQLYNFTPGVWVRGAGTWLNLEDDAKTTANGRTYRHNLDRDLDIWLFESGIDFGKRDLFAQGDILVFGILGGAVEATLDYKALERTFRVGGPEVGAYATYLKGGFFVDTLFKAIFAKLDPKDVRGFPDTLDSTTLGVRTDAGYRFGGMRRGPFVEPLATLAVSWSDIEDFALAGNAVDFDDDENVRGRVGLRLGTSTDVWESTTMEPFIVGSLWGTLSGDHHATLTSTGTTFKFTDEPEDLWGVVSAGVNFFNPGAQTAVFAKVDYTFADQTQGVGVKAGMRYNW